MLSLPLFLLVPAYFATASPIVPQGQAPEAINVNAAVVPLDHPVYHRFSTRAGKRKIFDAAAAKKEKEDIQRKHGTHLRKRALAERQKEKQANNDAAQRGKNAMKDDSAQKGKDDTKKKAQDDANRKAQDDARTKGKGDYSSNANNQKGKDDTKKKGQDDWGTNANNQKGKADAQKGKEDTKKKGQDDYSSNANAQKGKNDQKGKEDAWNNGHKAQNDAQKGKNGNDREPANGKGPHKTGANAQKGQNDQYRAAKSPVMYAYGTPGTHHPVDLLDIGDLRRRGQLKKRQGTSATDPLTNHQGKDFGESDQSFFFPEWGRSLR